MAITARIDQPRCTALSPTDSGRSLHLCDEKIRLVAEPGKTGCAVLQRAGPDRGTIRIGLRTVGPIPPGLQARIQWSGRGFP